MDTKDGELMIKNVLYVGFFGLIIAISGFITLERGFLVGPVLIALGLAPLLRLVLARSLARSAP